MPEPIVPVTTTVWGLEYSVHGAFIVYDPPKRRDIVHTIGTTRGLLAFFIGEPPTRPAAARDVVERWDTRSFLVTCELISHGVVDSLVGRDF